LLEGTALVPRVWAPKFEDGSVRCASGRSARGAELIGWARMSSRSKLDLAFEVWRAKDPAAVRQHRMLQSLEVTGFVPKVFESLVHPKSVFILTESPGSRSLATLIDESKAREGAPHLPLKTSLPLMLDMLRGVADLELLGAVAGDLSEQSMYVLGDGLDARVLLVDLRSVCFLDTDDDAVSCAGLAGRLHGSAYRHAPEVVGEVPETLSSNVWQLGLVFARLLLGGDAPTQAEAKNWPAEFDDFTAAGRAHIREAIRKHFELCEAPGFTTLNRACDDILDVVEGMLEKDPKKRLTAQAALSLMEEVAASRGIRSFSKRWPPFLPPEWTDEF